MFTSANAATSMTVGTYGDGQATIDSGSLPCVSVSNVPSITVHNLNCVGSGITSNTSFGIVVDNSLADNVKLNGPTITNNTVSGYGDNGIEVSGSNGTSGFSGINISFNDVHDVTGNEANIGDDSACIRIISNPTYPNPTAHSDVQVIGNSVYNCVGQHQARNNTGSGILLSTSTNATIARNVVHHTGVYNDTCGGPNGIWAYSSANVVIEFNETYDNETNFAVGGCDGNGFDLDGGITNSVVQYNYSHDNYGADFLVYAYTDSRQPQWSNNIFRYNIGQNSARAIFIANDDSLSMNACYIYNNTFYDKVAMVGANATAPINCIFANNIFYSQNSPPSVAFLLPNPSNISMVGNDYAGNGTWSWGNVGYSSFSDWQSATSQEEMRGVNVGLTSDPLLVAPGGGGITNGYHPEDLFEYLLLPGSPMLEAGLNLQSLYGIDVGTQNFYGTPVPDKAGKFSVGAGGILRSEILENFWPSGQHPPHSECRCARIE